MGLASEDWEGQSNTVTPLSFFVVPHVFFASSGFDDVGTVGYVHLLQSTFDGVDTHIYSLFSKIVRAWRSRKEGSCLKS